MASKVHKLGKCHTKRCRAISKLFILNTSITHSCSPPSFNVTPPTFPHPYLQEIISSPTMHIYIWNSIDLKAHNLTTSLNYHYSMKAILTALCNILYTTLQFLFTMLIMPRQVYLIQSAPNKVECPCLPAVAAAKNKKTIKTSVLKSAALGYLSHQPANCLSCTFIMEAINFQI